MPEHSHSLCITPPHILRAIAVNGSPAQRQIALQTLTASEQFRGQRKVMREVLSFLAMFSVGDKQRYVYDARFGLELPGALVRQEQDPPTDDPAVNEAYDGSGATYDLTFNLVALLILGSALLLKGGGLNTILLSLMRPV